MDGWTEAADELRPVRGAASLYVPRRDPWDCHFCRPIDPSGTTPTDR